MLKWESIYWEMRQISIRQTKYFETFRNAWESLRGKFLFYKFTSCPGLLQLLPLWFFFCFSFIFVAETSLSLSLIVSDALTFKSLAAQFQNLVGVSEDVRPRVSILMATQLYFGVQEQFRQQFTKSLTDYLNEELAVINAHLLLKEGLC